MVIIIIIHDSESPRNASGLQARGIAVFFFLCHGLTKYSDIVLHFNIISEVGALTISRD